MQEVVQVTYKGKRVDVVVGEITWGDETKAKSDAIVTKTVDGVPQQFHDVDKLNKSLVLASIKGHPFVDKEGISGKTMQDLDSLSAKDGKKLMVAYAKVNEVDENVCFPNKPSSELGKDSPKS